MYKIKNATPDQFSHVGRLMVDVYSKLDGFPKPEDQPAYYEMLLNVGEMASRPEAELLVATDVNDRIVAAVVYFGDVKYYGSGGTATQEFNSSGFRLLAVSEEARGSGLGKLLTLECIRKAGEKKHHSILIHTTMAMQRAWKMYEKIGFKRQPDLDFMQGDLPVFGFRYFLKGPQIGVSDQKGLMNISIRKYKNEYRGQVIDVWEQSVRATHHFLEDAAIEFYKSIVLGIDFNSFDVYCAFNDQSEMIGILGVADFKLEMLFLKPSAIGKGVGSFLMDFILNKLQVNMVDVNEANTMALNFYKKMGFHVYDRTPLDDHGKPYPVLKMRRHSNSG